MDRKFLYPSQEIPKKIKLLDNFLDRYDGKKPLAGTTVLMIQHQFGNQVPQALALLKLGLDPRRLFWIDIPYTSHASVRETVQAAGVPCKNFIVSDSYRVLKGYAPYQMKRVQLFVRKLLKRPSQKLIVLDDGAYFLEAASCFTGRFEHLAIVEQTTRGLIKMRNNASLRAYAKDIPVIKVADCPPKRTLEPPFIGRSVLVALMRKLRGWRKSRQAGDKCLILGFGDIGKWVAGFATEHLELAPRDISIFDPCRKKLNDARKIGYSEWDRGNLDQRFKLVIGCSGQSSFGIGDHVYLEDGAFLASASSGAVELSRQKFIEHANATSYDDIKIEDTIDDMSDVHSDIDFHFAGRSAKFLGGGFPINFCLKRVNCIPMRYIQPTIVMMVAATVQAAEAMNKGRSGMIGLDNKVCKWLDNAFREHLGEEADILLPPSPYR